MKLYRDRIELQPFGLVNLGNRYIGIINMECSFISSIFGAYHLYYYPCSCYANVVLQCLAFTRPLISYLIRGIHSKACKFAQPKPFFSTLVV